MSNLRLVSDGPGFDLPPRWDGLAVAWCGWKQRQGAVFICGGAALADVCESCGRGDHAPAGCEACGSRSAPLTNVGLMGDDPELTAEDLTRNDDAIVLATRAGFRGSVPARVAWRRLTAFRCPDCGLDTVVDGKDVWTLDPDDYSEVGSVSPDA